MAKKIIDTRSAAKKAKDARFRAEPVAIVQRPLRLINEKTGHVEVKAAVGGGVTRIWVESALYQKACRALTKGDGAFIKRTALAFA